MIHVSKRNPNDKQEVNTTENNNVVCEVNGYEIHVSFDNSGYPYWVRINESWNAPVMSWKTLKGAINWCEKN